MTNLFNAFGNNVTNKLVFQEEVLYYSIIGFVSICVSLSRWATKMTSLLNSLNQNVLLVL